jgi:hypothetical protein
MAGSKSNAAFWMDKDDNSIPAAAVIVNCCPTLDDDYPIPITTIVVVVDCRTTLPLSMQPRPPGKEGHFITIH